MKIREKKYLFEGLSNVLMIALVSLFTGFFMGVLTGAIGGVHTAAGVVIQVCNENPQIDMCQ